LLRRAGWIHDLGRLGVTNAIWDSAQPLTDSEREQIRLHPYLTERMLAYSPHLSDIGRLAALHHERLDGSGYPRGIEGFGHSHDRTNPRRGRFIHFEAGTTALSTESFGY
jgi:HD-GYP domain-containing protein (c-di-GMP phosphodiesterase class II)